MNEFVTRRENLLKKMEDNSVAIYFAGVAKYCSEDEAYPFKANRNFYYFTGIDQENSYLMIIKGTFTTHIYLFVDEYNKVKEKWTGKRLTFDMAREISGIDNVYSSDSFKNMLSLALKEDNNQYGNIKKLYLDLSSELKIDDCYSTANLKEELQLEYKNLEIENARSFACELRMVKTDDEVSLLKEAIRLTNCGILNVLSKLKPGMYEYELSDIFEFYGRSHGRLGLAFATIAAYGKNATCLHYPTQNERVGETGLVLFDLGYCYKGYNADISRTFPVNGKFSPLERDVYEAVLACNKAVIDYVKEGMTIADLQAYTRDKLKDECVARGLMKADEDISKYYYHNISHHLGLDTHDISIREKPLVNGNIITVEPGLYFANLGIGVRIEDDVLISEGHGVNLSKDIIKEVDDIEKLLSSRRS